LFRRRLPTPRPGQVLGLVGTNGIGKSTALKIMAGKEKPNLGKFDVPTLYIVVVVFLFFHPWRNDIFTIFVEPT
jgi:translation initiation factor RLI1